MENGIRFAGTVEIAGLHAEPNERRVATLKRHAERLFPSLRTEDATMWMGLRPCFPDNLPVIDGVAKYPGLFVACGHGHFGVTSAPATGMAIASLVAGAKPALDLRPFALARFG
jgi:D-amino-acid dehydrogenase